MKKGQKRWTRDELLLTINLYCKAPFGKLHKTNPDVIQLASLIERTPSAVAWKLGNFASLDPSLQARGIKGAPNTSKLDRKIWDEFYDNWDELTLESELLRIKKQKVKIESLFPEIKERKGLDKKRLIKTRINQSFFRSALLASYNTTCCITGLSQSELLVASHIVPWSKDKKNRLNPQNGLLLNSLHDKAFENGLISISQDYKIVVCPEIMKSSKYEDEYYFKKYHGQYISLPKRFLPNKKFLKLHEKERFRG